MNKIIGTFIILFSITSSCLGQEKVVLASESYVLSKREITMLSEQANAGSMVAAIRLSDFYFYDRTAGKKQEMREKALKWALIGSENGSPIAQFRAYQLLSTSDDKSNKVRALFWLKQSAKNGNEDAQGNLEECPNIDSKRESGTPCFGKNSE